MGDYNITIYQYCYYEYSRQDVLCILFTWFYSNLIWFYSKFTWFYSDFTWLYLNLIWLYFISILSITLHIALSLSLSLFVSWRFNSSSRLKLYGNAFIQPWRLLKTTTTKKEIIVNTGPAQKGTQRVSADQFPLWAWLMLSVLLYRLSMFGPIYGLRFNGMPTTLGCTYSQIPALRKKDCYVMLTAQGVLSHMFNTTQPK